MPQLTLKLVLKYLHDRNYFQSLIALERESNIIYHSYSNEVQFFKNLLLKGEFSESLGFIENLQDHLPSQAYRDIAMEILKQQLYELIQNPQEVELRHIFQKTIPQFCTEKQYQHLFALLTCRSIRQLPEFNKWTPMKGRWQCFQKIVPYLQQLLPSNVPHYPVSGDLDNIVHCQGQSHNKDNRFLKSNMVSERKDSLEYKEEKFEPEGKDELQQEIRKLQLQQISKTYGNINEKGKNSKKKWQNQLKNRSWDQLGVIKEVGKTRKQSQDIGNHDDREEAKSKQLKIQDTENKFLVESEVYRFDLDQKAQENYSKYYPKGYIQQLEVSNSSRYLQEEVKKNIAQLEANNPKSDERSKENISNQQSLRNEHFTFSNQIESSGVQEELHPKIINKLAVIHDAKAIRTCQYSSSGRYFALGTNSSVLKVFDVHSLYQQNKLQPLLPIYTINNLHNKSIFCLTWSQNEQNILTCSNDLSIKLVQFDCFDSHNITVIGKHDSCIRMVKINTPETSIISCGDDCVIKIWDIAKKKKCTNLNGHTASVSAFNLSNDSICNELYSVSKDSTLRKWDLRMGKCVKVSAHQDSQMTYISNNTNRIVVSHKNGTVSFFNQDLQLEHSISVHNEEIRSIDSLSHNNLLLTASFDGHVAIFTEQTADHPNYFQHNQNDEDKVVFATFLHKHDKMGFASTSTLGLCHLYSF